MAQEYKIKRVEIVKKRIQDAKGIIFIDYKGLNAEETQELRKRMHGLEVDYFIEKNTLIKQALNSLGIDVIDDFLVGPTALAVSQNDEVASAKAIVEFIKEVTKDKDFPVVKIGIVDGNKMEVEDINTLAKLPSKEELIAKTLYSLNYPIYGFVQALSGIIKKFVYVVNAIEKKQSENN
ncbi:MAG: 50S ribosomal protein L10 [Candidatus Cloacimonadota bacterium]|nr:50S ribosomal protein L10 [Candidatus Cloacimonadota bacterium]